jgi:hypothetical protein
MRGRVAVEATYAIALVLSGISLFVLVPWSLRHTAMSLEATAGRISDKIESVSRAQTLLIEDVTEAERAVKRLRDEVIKFQQEVNASLGPLKKDAREQRSSPAQFSKARVRAQFDAMVEGLQGSLEGLRSDGQAAVAQMQKLARKFRRGVPPPVASDVKEDPANDRGTTGDAPMYVVKWHGETGPRTSKTFRREEDAEAFYADVGDYAKKLVARSRPGAPWEATKEYGDPKWLILLSNDDVWQNGAPRKGAVGS